MTAHDVEPEDRIAAALRTINYEMANVKAIASARVEAAEARGARLLQVVRLGVAARQAQRAYFFSRLREDLIASKAAEQAFDDAVQAVGGV